jgi:multimeric flavodoxin WrbA
MRVVAVNGSARRGGNTTRLLRTVFEPLEASGHECELFELAGKQIAGCNDCRKCEVTLDMTCSGLSDDADPIIEAMISADALLLGSPVYYADMTASLKAIIERAGQVGRKNGSVWARKPGAAVVAVRRAGAMHALDSINHFFLIQEMVVVGSSYWNVGIGRNKGEVEADEEGMATMRRLGENMAWVLDRLGD